MNNDWLELEGKTVIVTGAASGIGKEVAQEFGFFTVIQNDIDKWHSL